MLGNEQSGRRCKINQNSHQIARMAFIYGRNNGRHSARAAARFGLKLLRE